MNKNKRLLHKFLFLFAEGFFIKLIKFRIKLSIKKIKLQNQFI